jgi:hypothetical protein
MMKRRLLISLLALGTAGFALGQEDPGKEVVGTVTVTVYYGTNGDPATAGPRAKTVDPEVAKRLAKEQKLKFSKYLELGRDVKPLYRSYENWAKPLQPSREILLRFEAQSNLSDELTRLDVELWLSEKKILKTDAVMTLNKPLLVLGPEWRGGRLIISMELMPGSPKGK